MIFNGRDLISFCGAGVSINKEIPPFTVGRTLTGIGGAGGHILGHAEDAPKTYTARINLHRTAMSDAWALKLKVAQWARSEGLADLVPTHDPTRKYRAICQGISDPTFVWGACTVDCVFWVPDARMLAVTPRSSGGTGSEAAFTNLGSADPVLKVTFVPLTTVSYPTIYLNGEAVLTVNGEVGADVPVVADFGAKTLKINGVMAMERINYMLTDWHPAFAAANTVGVEASTVSIEVTDRWL